MICTNKMKGEEGAIETIRTLRILTFQDYDLFDTALPAFSHVGLRVLAVRGTSGVDGASIKSLRI
jgi:hypothetical protein